MSIPQLPAEGSVDWYDHYTALDGVARATEIDPASGLFANPATQSSFMGRFSPSAGARPGCRWVSLGTSLTRGLVDDAPIAGKTNVSISDSWPTFTSMLSGQKLTLIKNAGITANLVSQMLARFDTDVAAYRPTLVTVDGGTNEFLTDVPFETYRTNFIALIAKVRSIGAIPVIVSILPNSSRRQQAASWVKWQRSYAASEGIAFLDFWSLLVDPSTGTLNSTAGSGDGTHPGLGGMLAMATLARSFLLPLVTPNSIPILTDNVDSDSILSNPMMMGTPSNGFAPGWSATAAPSGSSFTVGNDPAFCVGNYQQIDRVNTAGDTVIHQGVGLSGNSKVAVGDRIITMGRLFTSGNASGNKGGNDIIRLTFGTGTPRDLYVGLPYLDGSGATFYHEDVVPAGANQIDLSYIGNAGNGRARLGQVTIINATRGSLVVGSAF